MALERYSPFVSPSTFAVYGCASLTDRPPEWYTEQKFDVVIASQGMYGRYFAQPQRYHREVCRYEELFSRFDLLKNFVGNGPEIRIYRVK